jgi:hypothetical protein
MTCLKEHHAKYRQPIMQYTQMVSKVGFLLRQLGNKFLVFAHALLFNNSRSLQAQKFVPLPYQIPNF